MSLSVPSPRRALCDIPLRDADNTEIPHGSEVEQVAVDAAFGALACRLNKRGEVIGRSRSLVFVCFAGERYPVGLRSDLVRVVLENPSTHNRVITATEGGML